MGATHLPTKDTDISDCPVSSNFLKRLWCRYLHSPHKVSLPPRLLVVCLLVAQMLFLAAVKLGPGGSAWTSLSSFEGLAVGKEVRIGQPLKFRWQEKQESVQDSDSMRESSVWSRQGESFMESNDLPSSISTIPSFSSSSNGDRDDTATDGANAVAMSTSSGATKGFGNGAKAGKGELLLLQEAAQDKAAVVEDPTPSENNANKMSKSSETSAAFDRKGELAEKRRQELASTSHDGAHTVQWGHDTRSEFAQKVNDSGTQCKYGYIYVYSLPAEYNRDIIANCTALNVFLNVCDTLLNGGLGNMLGEASPLGQKGSWFVSDQFTAEVVFHKRILEHPCLTSKPEEASGFYVPYYAGLDVGRFLWKQFTAERRDRVSNQLLEWLSEQPAWKKYGGWRHFMMIGRITWDFRRSRDEDWGSGFFYHPLMQNMTRLLIEQNPWDYMEMAVPYPTNFHPQSDADLVAWQNHIRSLKRSNLFSFAGARRSRFLNDFRGILLYQCQQSQSCQSLDCSNQTCDNNLKSLELFMNSTFCLQPRGDSFTRRSMFDCLLAGSIPVFFWHRTAYMQYKWHLPEDAGSYSVFISKDDMRNGTNIEDVLNSYSVEKVQSMQETVIEIVPRLVYAASGFSFKENKDAFDVTLEGVMKRFTELNLNLQR